MELKGLSAYALEHSCQLSNGYLKKQYKGKGSIGSDIIEKIHQQYHDLSLLWLLTGKKPMLTPTGRDQAEQSEVNEEEKTYSNLRTELVQLLKDKINVLESSIADKDRIIALLEAQLAGRSGGDKDQSMKLPGSFQNPENPS
jgi:hypothetical protein